MKFTINGCSIDTEAYEVRRDGEQVAVEPQVFDLLVQLLENRGRLVSKEEIIERVWGGRIVSESAISSRIKTARKAIGDDGAKQSLIQTVRRRGFRLVGDVEVEGDEASVPASDVDVSAPAPRAYGDERPVVAVVPFSNNSNDAEQEYFADGITGDIIDVLARHRWLSVLARSSMFAYKGQSPDSRQLRADLGASYVVTGSVRRTISRMRVGVQLVDARTGEQMWAENYNREFEDLFLVQDEIVDTIAARIEPEVGLAERKKVLRKPRTTLRAWDCYHLGINHFFKFTAPDNMEAQLLLGKSREIDPDFGQAHAWWAYAVVLGMIYWDTDPDDELLDEALAAVRRALEIDAQNAIFHALLARINLARREYSAAIISNENAIRLNSSLAAAYCGLGDSFAYEGRYDEAIENFKKAAALSHNDPQRWAFLSYGALAYIFRGDYETALDWADKAAVIPNCQYWTTAHRTVALAYLRREDDARRSVQRLLTEKPEFSRTFARRKLFYLKKQDQLDLYMEGLRKAGVPEG